MDTIQADVQGYLGKKAPVKPVTKLQTHGFEGKLEGPAGLTYWTVRVTSQYTSDEDRLSDNELLKEGFENFGQTIDPEMTK